MVRVEVNPVYDLVTLPWYEKQFDVKKNDYCRFPRQITSTNSFYVPLQQPTSANVTDVDGRKKPVASPRPAQSAPKSANNAAHTKTCATNNALFSGKPAGDKENIPLAVAAATKKQSPQVVRSEVIDLCEVAEDDRRSGSAKTNSPSAGAASSLQKSPEVIDLCGESPIKRSVPSIAATLMPRKRKLDILKEGGLEVTPISISLSSSSSSDVVTITRQPAADADDIYRMNPQNAHADNIAAYMKHLQASVPEAEMTVELVEPKEEASSDDDDYASLQSAKMAKSAPQVLDLRTMRSNVEGNSLLKSISPSLGPNIEISLVPSDNSGTAQRDERRRKSMQLPLPALRKISTGELAMNTNNGSAGAHSQDLRKGRAKMGSARNRAEAYVSVTSSPLETTLTPASFRPPAVANSRKMADISAHVPDVEYLTAFYGSIVSAAAAAAATNSSTVPGYVGGGVLTAPDASGAHGLQLSPAELIYMNAPAAHLRQQRQELAKMELNDKSIAMYNDNYRQKLAAILKNNTVSIVGNYDKIVQD